MMRARSALLFACLCTMPASLALAEGDRQKSDQKSAGPQTSPPPKPTDRSTPSSATKPKPGDTKTVDAIKPKHTSAQVMKITQDAMTHIRAAEQALAKDNVAAAKSSLARSEQALEKLYDTPALAAVMNEIDEAIRKTSGEKPAMQPMDLAPLTASVRSYQAYLDPEVIAGVEDASDRAKKGDAQGTADALRLARNRMAIDVAFLPVEEAYVRVLAAQHALDSGDRDQATRVLRGLPIVVSEVEISTPLVPIRFKLHAAAAAVEQGDTKQAQTLLRDATQEIQAFEKQTARSPMASEVSRIVDDIERLNQRVRSGSSVQAADLRELAQRTRSIGV